VGKQNTKPQFEMKLNWSTNKISMTLYEIKDERITDVGVEDNEGLWKVMAR
jgi:hypothetical protein